MLSSLQKGTKMGTGRVIFSKILTHFWDTFAFFKITSYLKKLKKLTLYLYIPGIFLQQQKIYCLSALSCIFKGIEKPHSKRSRFKSYPCHFQPSNPGQETYHWETSVSKSVECGKNHTYLLKLLETTWDTVCKVPGISQMLYIAVWVFFNIILFIMHKMDTFFKL